MSLEESGGALSWASLFSLAARAVPGSAMHASAMGDASEWSTATKTNAILADLYDLLTRFRHDYREVHLREGATLPEPVFYPRPGDEEREKAKEQAARDRLKELDDILNGGANAD